MDDVQCNVQKNIAIFAKSIPVHLEKWRAIIQESVRPVQALVNFAEQLRAVEKTNIKHMANFHYAQELVLFKINECISEEILTIKELTSELNKANQDVKNKLINLENSTLSLDWNNDNSIIKGSALQPPLTVMLQDGFKYVNFFTSTLKNINNLFKHINIRNEENMKNFEEAFKIDFKNNEIMYFIALTQYIDNANALL